MGKIFMVILFFFLIVCSYSSIAVAEEKPYLSEGKSLYMHYCTSCHGNKGDGKGFNAKNLDPRPANHTDAKLMSKRSDKALYEVIYGGGRAAGKSTLMPPWGNNLNERQIRSLIIYLRKLCSCKEE
jgi:mono/diheme cytochrome c family protein